VPDPKPTPRASTKAKPPAKEPLPTHKDDLAWLAIERHGIPSYEAWAMTVPELTEKLEALRA
jgi:hypothetical protein